MPGCSNGAELVKKLRGTGTPDGKLAGARRLLADVHRVERRVATSTEVLAALETGEYALGDERVEIGRAQEGTLQKAREIVRTGEWTGPPADAARPIEEQLLAGDPPDLDADAPKAPEPAAAPPPPRGTEIEDGGKAVDVGPRPVAPPAGRGGPGGVKAEAKADTKGEAKK